MVGRWRVAKQGAFGQADVSSADVAAFRGVIELIGRSEKVDLGGESGTKRSYKGERFFVRTWRYID
jgi:hypothetical protein